MENGWLVFFYGKSTIVGYVIRNYVYEYTLYMGFVDEVFR